MIFMASWIVKPVGALTPEEMKSWTDLSWMDMPPSQTLAWGGAVEAVSGKGVIVFSRELRISALFIVSGLEAECINGPVMDWEAIRSSEILNQAIARVVHALVHANPDLVSIRLKPRLRSGPFGFLSDHLAFPVDRVDRSHTLMINLAPDEEAQWSQLPSRIRHEISRARKAGVQVSLHQDSEAIFSFWSGVRNFYGSRGLYAPEYSFVESLLFSDCPGLEGQVIRAEHPESGSFSELLLIHVGSRSYYFYAFDQRTETCPNISLNACAQWEAIREAARRGSLTYDLNGILKKGGADPGSFSGVDQYKRKFKGEEVEWFSPLICFGASD